MAIFRAFDLASARGIDTSEARALVERSLTEMHDDDEVFAAIFEVVGEMKEYGWVGPKKLESMVRVTFEGKIENATCRPIL